MLGGCTGVGKTAVLLELRRRGEQVLDLEAICKPVYQTVQWHEHVLMSSFFLPFQGLAKHRWLCVRPQTRCLQRASISCLNRRQVLLASPGSLAMRPGQADKNTAQVA